MQWEAIAAVGEVVGAIAVVITIIYLARQIRGNIEATRVTAYHQAQQQLWSAAECVATDPVLAELIAGHLASGLRNLAPADRARVEFMMGSFFFGMENMMALHERGHISDDSWRNVFANNLILIGSPLGREILAARPGPLSRRLETAILEERTDGSIDPSGRG